MRFTAYKLFSLAPIGDISFVSDKKSKRKGKQILISDISIYQNTMMDLDIDTTKALLKSMKEKKSDLLTDGHRFYTTFGSCIKEIDHPQFYKELELDKLLYLKRIGFR